ncbi:MAG: hypothetical protein V4474_03475 [Patescibacteria group bacterium]
MQRTLSLADVLALQDYVTIGGDLLLLPQVRLPNLSESFALQKAGIIDIETSMTARNRLSLQQIDEENRYYHERAYGNPEPAWVAQLPLHRQKWLRWSYATRELDPIANMVMLPNTGLYYMVLADGLCHRAAQVLDLFRLQEVNQLGFLQAPWVAMTNQHFVTPLSNSTRWLHSLDVMCVGSAIGRNIGLEERGAFSTLRTALLSHDRGTPAGGDSVKLIDPKAFDEDRHYKRLLRTKTNRRRWNDLKEKYDIDELLLVETIHNRGFLGQILDIADKLSYVARDIESCMNVFVAEKDEDVYVGMKALDELLKEQRTICGIWDSVRRQGDQMVFIDAGRLIAFLKARIVLFRELYFHPRARFGEYLISRVLVKHMYDQGKLTRDQLLGMSDGRLLQLLQEEYGEWNVVRALSLKSQVRSFQTREQASAFKRELEQEGNPFSLVEDHLHAVKTGAHFWVDCPGGPKPLSEAYPGDAQELWEMANMLPAVHVYYLNKGDDPADDIGTILGRIRQTALT